MDKFRKRQFQSGQRIKGRQPERISTDSGRPIFSLNYLSKKFCFSKCINEEKLGFANKLFELSQLTWQQLKLAPKHGMGYEPIDRGSIKDGIPPHITEDIRFIAFRFHGLKPMVGYREGTIFHIIWFDREFKLYDHG